MLLCLGHLDSATKQFSCTSRTRGAFPAGWQLTAPPGCAVEGKWCRFPRLGLWGTSVLDKATMYWGAPTHTPKPPASQYL